MEDGSHDLQQWRVPDQIVRFMSNLPRARQADALHDISWVLRHVWNFFEFKVKTDADDLRRGQSLQQFADFIIDTLLQRCERREDAETYLFLFLKSLQSCLARKKTPLLHSFARFLGVFGSTDEEETQVELGRAEAEAEADEEAERQKKEKAARRSTRGGKGSVDNARVKVPSTNLPRGVLDVYLFSRCALMAVDVD